MKDVPANVICRVGGYSRSRLIYRLTKPKIWHNVVHYDHLTTFRMNIRGDCNNVNSVHSISNITNWLNDILSYISYSKTFIVFHPLLKICISYSISKMQFRNPMMLERKRNVCNVVKTKGATLLVTNELRKVDVVT